LRTGDAQTLLPGCRGHHAVAGGFERRPQLFAECRAVINHQDGRPARRRALPCLKQFLHLREQIPDVVGFADILVCAGLEPSNAIPHLRL
jgi:hypothetical protein